MTTPLPDLTVARLTRADLEQAFDGTLVSLAGMLSGVESHRLRRILRDAGVLTVTATDTVIRPEFLHLTLTAGGDYTAVFTAWTYHGCVSSRRAPGRRGPL